MDNSKFVLAINELEAWLSENDLTRKEVESSIVTLRKLAGMNNNSTTTTWMGGIAPRSSVTPGEIDVIPSNRVQAALKSMSGRFFRQDLYTKSIKDGYGDIAPGTFANIFGKLLKRGSIVLVDGEFGKRNAVYMRSDEHQALRQDPSTSQGHDLFQG